MWRPSAVIDRTCCSSTSLQQQTFSLCVLHDIPLILLPSLPPYIWSSLLSGLAHFHCRGVCVLDVYLFQSSCSSSITTATPLHWAPEPSFLLLDASSIDTMLWQAGPPQPSTACRHECLLNNNGSDRKIHHQESWGKSMPGSDMREKCTPRWRLINKSASSNVLAGSSGVTGLNVE